jgi:exodeoxyribonuclease VII small subunit
MNDSNVSFEESFKKLESILQRLNEGKVTLDESLKLFEVANSLIISCNAKLKNAEQKIQTLLKDREGKLVVENEIPAQEEFSMNTNKILKE